MPAHTTIKLTGDFQLLYRLTHVALKPARQFDQLCPMSPTQTQTYLTSALSSKLPIGCQYSTTLALTTIPMLLKVVSNLSIKVWRGVISKIHVSIFHFFPTILIMTATCHTLVLIDMRASTKPFYLTSSRQISI